MKLHHMVDLETLDTKPTSIVVSVGLVTFRPDNFETVNEYYAILEMGPQMYHGRTRGEATVAWWAQQSEEARKVFSSPRVAIDTVFDDLDRRIDGSGGVWGNGSDFDCVILGSLYDTFRRTKPWSFGRNRCLRTVKNMLKPKEYVAPERAGTHHNALDDARFQVQELRAICEATGVRF